MKIILIFLALIIPYISFSQNNCYVYSEKAYLDIKSYSSWYFSSLPEKQFNLFPESELIDSIGFGFNRAKLSWFSIDPIFLRNNSATPAHIKDDPSTQSNHFVREVFEKEIYPDKEYQNGIPSNLAVLNLAFYPSEKGPYNYDLNPTTFSAGIDSNGLLLNPKSRWGGIMKEVPIRNFELSKIRYIEFWLMDPFVYDTTHSGGEMYINIGDISEDILKDNWLSYENSSYNIPTIWGYMSTGSPEINYWENLEGPSTSSDCGLDGINDLFEKQFFGGTNYYYINKRYNYLSNILDEFGNQSNAYKNAINDPSNDNYHYYRGSDYDSVELGILERYKRFNLLEGNSIYSNNENYQTRGKLLPDFEDVNKNFELEVAENYFQYLIHIKPDSFILGNNFIDDTLSYCATFKNGTKSWVKWYHFSIPIEKFQNTFGQSGSFKRIKFIRIFLKGFEKPIIMRFATFDLVRQDDYAYYIPNNIESEKLYVYPNPNNGSFTIYIPDIEIKSVLIYNSTGKAFQNFEYKDTNELGPKFINTLNYDKGVYFLKVIDINNNLYYEKIIIN